jgi:hypothetical protein
MRAAPSSSGENRLARREEKIMATCDNLYLCPRAVRNPSNPDVVLFWDTSDPDTVVKIAADSWVQFLADVKAEKYDNL